MVSLSPSPPLSALDAVVIDTETTGLDVRTARMIQFGGIRIRGTELRDREQLSMLFNPGVPISPATTAIHGIGRRCPRCAAFCRRSRAHRRIPGGDVIGHSVEFDLAILRREHELAGLDLEASARARCALSGAYSRASTGELRSRPGLDRLGIDNQACHTAPGDAHATAKVFAALLPMLRQQGIRTLAEAEAAHLLLRRAGNARGRRPHDGRGAGQAPLALMRIDSYPDRHRVRDLMSSPPVIADPDMPVVETIRLLVDRKVSLGLRARRRW